MTSARRQLVPLPSNLNTGKGPTPQGHPCFSFRPLEQPKRQMEKWAEMNGNDRQIKFPRHRLLRCRRPTYSPVSTCNRTTFSATIQLRQSDHRTNISYKKVFFSYDCGPIPSYDFTHDAPRRFGRKLLRGDAGRRSQIQIAGFSLPLLRSQSEHGRKLAQSCSRTKISPGNPPSLPRRRSQIQNRLLPRPFFDPNRTTAPPWLKATVGTNGKT